LTRNSVVAVLIGYLFKEKKNETLESKKLGTLRRHTEMRHKKNCSSAHINDGGYNLPSLNIAFVRLLNLRRR